MHTKKKEKNPQTWCGVQGGHIRGGRRKPGSPSASWCCERRGLDRELGPCGPHQAGSGESLGEAPRPPKPLSQLCARRLLSAGGDGQTLGGTLCFSRFRQSLLAPGVLRVGGGSRHPWARSLKRQSKWGLRFQHSRAPKENPAGLSLKSVNKILHSERSYLNLSIHESFRSLQKLKLGLE